MHKHKYLYTFNYDNNESDLCKLESRYIFKDEEKDKLLFSNLKVEPSSSAFIKRRMDISSFSDNYSTLISQLKEEQLNAEGFKVEYIVLDGDTTPYAERLKKLKDIGYCIDGEPDYKHPTISYTLCHHEGVWYFGILIKDTFEWHKHKDKPRSYSNSISMNIAKALVNISSQTNKEATLLDACCGAGTIMLEACFSGHHIEGCDINWKMCQHARENLAHFGYSTTVYRSDIKDISHHYDAAIIDLPYNLLSCADDDQIAHIIESTAELSNRLVIVSTSDITDFINNAGFKISDSCEVSKRGKAVFTRKIWLCEKNE